MIAIFCLLKIIDKWRNYMKLYVYILFDLKYIKKLFRFIKINKVKYINIKIWPYKIVKWTQNIFMSID
jgi:hypothetical protein